MEFINTIGANNLNALLETVRWKSWFTILRMSGPLEPWVNRTLI